MSDETKIFTKNDKNGDKCASGGQESGLKLIFERGVAILVRPWRFPGQPKKFVFFSIKVGTINSGTSLDSREQFKKTGKLELIYCIWGLFYEIRATEFVQHPGEFLHADGDLFGDRCASAIPVNAESRALQQVRQQPRMDSRGMLFEFLFRHIATPRIAPGLLLVQSFSALATASQVSS